MKEQFLLRRQTSAWFLSILFILFVASNAIMQLTNSGPVAEYSVLALADWTIPLASVSILMIFFWLIPALKNIGLAGFTLLLITAIYHQIKIGEPVAYQFAMLIVLWIAAFLRGSFHYLNFKKIKKI